MIVSVIRFNGITWNLKLAKQISFAGERIKLGSFIGGQKSLQKTKPTVGWCLTLLDCSLLAQAGDTELEIPKPSWQWKNIFRDKDSTQSLLFCWRAVAPVPQEVHGCGQCQHGLGASLLPPAAPLTPLSPHTACSFVLLWLLCQLVAGSCLFEFTPV